MNSKDVLRTLDQLNMAVRLSIENLFAVAGKELLILQNPVSYSDGAEYEIYALYKDKTGKIICKQHEEGGPDSEINLGGEIEMMVHLSEAMEETVYGTIPFGQSKPRIILHIRGGHLQSIQANTPDILIHVLDYDNAYAERDGEFEGEPSKPDEIKRDSELLMEIAEVLEEREKERKKNKS